MKLYDKFIYFAFIYLIYRNKWVLIESTDTSSTPPPSSGGDCTSGTPGQDSTPTPTADGGNDTGTKTGVELSLKATAATNEFNFNKEGNVVTFTAKDSFGFSSVKTKKGGCSCCNSSCCGSDITIWDARNASEYATKVVLYGKGKKDKIVSIYLPNDNKKSFKKDKNNLWSEYAGSLPSNGNAKSSSGGKELNSVEYYTDIKLFKVDPNDPNKTKELDTNDFETKKDGNNFTCTAKGNVLFKAVKGGNTDLWSTNNENEYANKVVSAKRHSGDIDVTIHLPNNKTKLFIKETDKSSWKEIDTTKVNPISINIYYEHETHSYDNKLDNDVRTFTAKTGFAFNGAHDYIIGNKVEIWKTTKENEYSKKIVNEGGKKITIHIGEGTSDSKKVFKKGTEGTWKQDGS